MSATQKWFQCCLVVLLLVSSVTVHADEEAQFRLNGLVLTPDSRQAPLDQKTMQDLELHVLLKELTSYAPSAAAKERIGHLMRSPFIDRAEIRKRQQVIEAIANDDELFNAFESAFSLKHKALGLSNADFLGHYRSALKRLPSHGVLGGSVHGVAAAFFAHAVAQGLPERIDSIAEDPSAWNVFSNMAITLGTLAPSMMFAIQSRELRLPIALAYIRAYQAHRLLASLERYAGLAAFREIIETCDSQKKCIRTLNLLGSFYPIDGKLDVASLILGVAPLVGLPGHYYLARRQEPIMKLLSAMTDLEVYFAFAKFYRTYRSALNFPKILDTEHARLKIVDGEHPFPLFKREKSVPNSVEFDEVEGNHTYIITGPNTGGKTTFQQMYMTLTVMAQMGLPVPAQAMELTPFYLFTNFTTNSGSVDVGKSTFRTQADRVAEMLQHTKSYRPALTAMDEILTGTSNAEHQAIERATLRAFHESEGVLATLATHDRTLTEFADKMPGLGNLQVTAVGHRILPGPSTVYNAFEILEEANVPPHLIQYAKEYFEEAQQQQTACRRVLVGE